LERAREYVHDLVIATVLSTTFLGPQPAAETLSNFYQLVKPSGPGWKKVREAPGAGPWPDSPAQALIGWVLGCLMVYSALFGARSLVYGRMPQFYAWLAVYLVSAVGVWRVLGGFWSGARA
jgi:hypothetical protein